MRLKNLESKNTEKLMYLRRVIQHTVVVCHTILRSVVTKGAVNVPIFLQLSEIRTPALTTRVLL